MTGFELRTAGVRINSSANRATTTVFSIQLTVKNALYKSFPMTGFELWTSGVGIHCSATEPLLSLPSSFSLSL